MSPQGQLRVAAIGMMILAYALVYIGGIAWVGSGVGALAIFPVLVVAWWWGTVPAVVTGIVVIPLNAGLCHAVLGSGWSSVYADGALFGHLATVGAAFVGGWFRTVNLRGDEASAALRSTRAALNAVVENTRDWVFTLDGDLNLLVANTAFSDALDRLRGTRPQQGQAILELLPRDLVPPLAELLRRGLEGEEVSDTIGAAFPGGSWELAFSVRPMRDPEGVVAGLACSARDVSMRTAMVDRLRRSDRLSTLGSLVATVLHELNNPLAYVRGNLDFLVEEMQGGDADLLGAVRDAREGTERVSATLEDLRSFSRIEECDPLPIEVSTAIGRALKMTHNRVRHRARLVTDLKDMPRVLAHEGQLAQVFVNLLVNAVEALPDGQVETNRLTVSATTDASGWATIRITDSGVGIAPDLIDRVFDPFVTSKPVGKGAGLGLAVSEHIVRSLGGQISLDSRPGRGTTATVRLPPAPAPDLDLGQSVESHRIPLRRCRVLVVDDEEAVGRAIVRLLPRHDVQSTTDAYQAMDLLRNDSNFDLVLCDLMMPGMTGMELHKAISHVRPGLEHHLAFMTGGAFSSAALDFLDQVKNPRISKPFTRATLEDLLARSTRRGQRVLARDANTEFGGDIALP